MPSLRNSFMWLNVFTLVALLSTAALAQPAPAYPIRMVAGMPAGGGADVSGRRLAAQLGRVLKQNIVVENIAGAAGTSAGVTVSGGNPDGHALFFAPHPVFAVNPILYAVFAKFLAAERVKFADLIKKQGIKVN